MALKCNKYLNPYGTLFIECKNNKSLILSWHEVYPEDVLFCPYCGSKLKDNNKEANNIVE